MSDVEPEEVSWVWEPRIARRKLTLLEGDPGAGKTWLALTLAAMITRGWPWPGADGRPGETRTPAPVLYLSAEDGLADTLRPRLDQVGADVTLVHALTGTYDDDGVLQAVTLADHGLLRLALDQVRPALLVVDPIQQYLGVGVDMHRANEVRPLLARLVALAEEFNCAALVIRHLGKSTQDKAVYRGLGSIDFAAAARSILLAGADPKDPKGTRRALAQVKNSLGPIAPTMGYTIGTEGFCWTGVSDLTARDLLAPDQMTKEKSALEAAEDFLTEILTNGPLPFPIIAEKAKRANVKGKTLYRAKTSLGIISFKETARGPWRWKLPEGGQGDQNEENPLNTPDDHFGNVGASPTAARDTETPSKVANDHLGNDPRALQPRQDSKMVKYVPLGNFQDGQPMSTLYPSNGESQNRA